MIHAGDTPTTSLASRISLHALSRQCENGVAIIGRGDQFLELPPEGLQFLDWLNEGLTLGEARARFEATYNPFPDEEVFEVMQAFLASDFIAAIDGQAIAPRHAPLKSSAPWISPKWAQALFSSSVLIAWMLICISATLLWIMTPELWPRRADYFWTDYYFLILLVGLLWWLGDMVLHELSHWLAARAKGIEATITWTQRLGFFPMSQTIMHNIWAVPRQARFLPLAAGMMTDVFVISLEIYLLFGVQQDLFALPLLIVKLLKFHILASTMGLAAQFWLFSQMDGYFLLSALFGQRNLQADTFHWLKSKMSRSSRFDPPASGMKYIYGYALITLLWGGLFMSQFLLVDLPIKLQLLWTSWLRLSGESSLAPLEFADGLAVLVSQGIYWGLLLYAYWRDTLPGWRRN